MMPVCRMRENEHRIITWAFRLLGASSWVGRQVGQIVDGKEQYWSAFRDGLGYDFQKWHWKTDGADGHFTLADMGGREIYDPHDPKQAGYWINKRFVMRRLLYRCWEI